MAPSKPSGKGPTPSKHSKASTKTGPKPGSSKVKKAAPAPKTVQLKTKSTKLGQKKKKRVYTEKELNIPKLNSIVPAGIQKPNGMKKGKTFVDDKETMMTILAMVQAEKEGNIESKMMRARQMEEIREARKAEQEKRDLSKKKKLDETKDEIRHRKKANKRDSSASAPAKESTASESKPKKKRVSFG